RSRWAHEHPDHVIVATAVASTALTGWATSRLGGPTRPMLYSQYLVPMCTLAMLAQARVRVLLVGLMVVSATASTVLSDPTIVWLPGFLVSLLTILSSGALAFFAGHSIFHLFRLSFLQRQELSRTAHGLAALDRAKSEFFANVSHELRTPLMLVLVSLR